MREVWDLSYRHSCADGVADLKHGEGHAWEKEVGIGIGFHIDITAGGGLKSHLFDVGFGDAGKDGGLFQCRFLDVDRSASSCFSLRVFDFELAEFGLGVAERKFILLDDNSGEERVTARLEPGLFEIAPGEDQLRIEFFFTCLRFGLRLGNQLLRFGKIELGFAQLVSFFGEIGRASCRERVSPYV